MAFDKDIIERLARLESDLEKANKDLEDLLVWKSACNKWAAAWGGVCMLAVSTGTVIVNYYTGIKSYLIALWSIK